MKLTGCTILITGGSSGIGLELATQLQQRGNTVIVTGRNPATLEAARAALPGLHTIQSDVADPAAIDSLYQHVTTEHPALNVLINNAGIMRKINLFEADPADVTQEITINLTGAIRMTARFIPHLTTRRQAAIVNVSSGLAFLPTPVSPVYCAAKAGLHSFTQSLRVQMKDTRVQVVELAPPLTDTPLTSVFDPAEYKGVPVMSPARLARRAIAGIEAGRTEIRPGLSNVLKLMSRIAPEFMLNRMGRPAMDQMLAAARA